MGATAEILAQALEVPKGRASSILYKMHRRGLLIARGQWNPWLGKETTFMQRNLRGFVYGRPGTEDIERFLKSGVLSRDVNIILNEVLKDSRLKRFTMAARFRDPPYRFTSPRIQRSVRKLTELIDHVATTKIAGQLFLYDRRLFNEEELQDQMKFWEDYVKRQKSEKASLGRFHEEFIR